MTGLDGDATAGPDEGGGAIAEDDETAEAIAGTRTEPIGATAGDGAGGGAIALFGGGAMATPGGGGAIAGAGAEPSSCRTRLVTNSE